MLTCNDIERICNELERYVPFISSTAAYSWLIDNEYNNTEATGNAFWQNNFVFLLLVLAANGVPYEC